MPALVLTVVLLTATVASDAARLTVDAGTGPDPVLPPPEKSLLPTIDIAPAIGWPDGVTPTPGPDLRVGAFATGLDHPRWLYVLPNGDVLVAETNAPPRPDDRKGIQGWIMGLVMKRAGSASPSANRITLLRDADHDGEAEIRSVFLEGLNSPFGMTLVDRALYVANTDAVVRYDVGNTIWRVGADSTWVSFR